MRIKPTISRDLKIKGGLPRLQRENGVRPLKSAARFNLAGLLIKRIARLSKKSFDRVHAVVLKYHLHYALAVVLVQLVILQVAILGINGSRTDHPILNLHFRSQNITLADHAKIKTLTDGAIALTEKQPLQLRVGDKTYGRINARQLGAHYTSAVIVSNIYSYGRYSSIWKTILTQDKVLFGLDAYRLGYPNIDHGLASQYFSVVNKLAAKPPRDAAIRADGNDFQIVHDIPGYDIDIGRTIARLQRYDTSVDGTYFHLSTVTRNAGIRSHDVEKLGGHLNDMALRPLKVTMANKSLILSQGDIINCLSIQRLPNPKHPNEQTPQISFNTINLDRTAVRIVNQADVTALPRLVDGGKTTSVGKDGLLVDGNEVKIALMRALLARLNGVSKPSDDNINLPLAHVTALTIPKNVQPDMYDGQLAATKNSQPAVTLTVSGVPNSTYLPGVLAALDKYNISALFMVTGRNVALYPEETRQIIAHHQRLGLSTYDYHPINQLSPPQLLAEIQKSQQAVLRVTGIKATLFQPPYNEITSQQMTYLHEHGISTVQGTIDGLDWAVLPPLVIAKHVRETVTPGAVLMLHASTPTTALSIPLVQKDLRYRGYEIN